MEVKLFSYFPSLEKKNGTPNENIIAVFPSSPCRLFLDESTLVLSSRGSVACRWLIKSPARLETFLQRGRADRSKLCGSRRYRFAIEDTAKFAVVAGKFVAFVSTAVLLLLLLAVSIDLGHGSRRLQTREGTELVVVYRGGRKIVYRLSKVSQHYFYEYIVRNVLKFHYESQSVW